jgi:hypothetical protein
MPFYDRLHDRKPEPGSSCRVAAHLVRLVETIEYPGQVFGRDAGTRIVDFEANPPEIRGPDTHEYRLAARVCQSAFERRLLMALWNMVRSANAAPVAALKDLWPVRKPSGRFIFCEHGRAQDQGVGCRQDRETSQWRKLPVAVTSTALFQPI